MNTKGIFMTVMQVGLFAFIPYAIVVGNVWWWLLAIFMYTLMAGVGVVVTYHRLLTHKTFKSTDRYRWFSTFFAMIGSLLSPLEWVQQHVAHHRYVETDKDPHSPVQLGWKVLFFCFHRESGTSILAYKLSKEKFMQFMHKYFYLVLGTYITFLYAIGGLQLVAFAWALPCLATLWGQIAVILAHDDESATNGSWISRILTFNETWHKYHHEKPGDITKDGAPYWFIQLIRTDRG